VKLVLTPHRPPSPFARSRPLRPADARRRPISPRIVGALGVIGMLGAFALSPTPSLGAPIRLADTTFVDSWQLPNGLRVVTRDVRRAPGVSVTLAFGTGSEQDAPGREGRASLLAHVAFLSATGEFPERTMAELETARPLGWRIEVGRRHTRLTEVAKVEQFPGVLHQFALRLQGVTPTASTLAAAQKSVVAQLSENYRDRVANALDYQVRDLGTPGGFDRALAYASGKGVASATLRETVEALRTLYVPANAVLSLAGNLSGSGVDIRRVVENEFGSIPAGTRAPDAVAQPLAPTFKLVEREGIDDPVGVIGIITPALSDTSHPSFYMHSLLVGGSMTAAWGRTKLIPQPFVYSLLDDPEMLRLHPPIMPSDFDSTRIREAYFESILALSKADITYEEYAQLHGSVLWMLGGPMNSDLRRRARTEPGVLAALSTTAAMRELWGGEAFWSKYLERFNAVDRPSFGRWSEYFLSPEHQVQLMFVPSWLLQQKK